MKRHSFILLAVAGALMLGACGGGDSDNGAASGRDDDKAFEGALKFAKCMREHGVDMPDPVFQKGGGVLSRMRDRKEGGISPEPPAFKTADESCHHHLAEIEERRAEGGKR